MINSHSLVIKTDGLKQNRKKYASCYLRPAALVGVLHQQAHALSRPGVPENPNHFCQ
jgi:hypothetical protein